MQRASVAAGLMLALAFCPRSAVAQARADAEARAQYDAGAAAYEAKDFARAATLFAHADELAPNPLVLKLGLAAATQADDALLGMTLVLRAEARAVDGSLADVARHARARFGSRVGFVRVVCLTRGACRATVDGRSGTDGQLLVVKPGEVDAVIVDGAQTARLHVEVAARAIVDLVEPAFVPPAPSSPPAPAPAPAPPPERPPPSASGLSPAIFWSGVVITGVLGGVTVASGVDTLDKHASFSPRTSTPDDRERGVSAEKRTNVLLAATLGAAAVTAVIGVFFTAWRRDDLSKVADGDGAATIRF